VALPGFWLDPCLAPPVLLTFSQQNFKRFEAFLAKVLTICKAYVEFDKVGHSKSIFITTENHHAGEAFMLALLFFSWPAVAPQTFNSRIATVCGNVEIELHLYFHCSVHSKSHA